MLISIVSPVYMAENIVLELVKRLTQETKKITDDFELILVEDGSKDCSWNKIVEAASSNNHVKGIKLSRNFGQHFSITAGLQHSSGNYVVIIDCDLQDDPKYIPTLLQKLQEGFEIVYTKKIERKHKFLKNLAAKFFYLFFNLLNDNKIGKQNAHIGTYTALTKKAVTAYLSIKDYRRQYLILLQWIGFSSTCIEVEHHKRFEGKSTYTFRKLVSLAFDGFTAHSDKLLRVAVIVGFILSSVSFLSAFIIIIRYLVKPFLAGWASIIVLILLMSGLIILSIGICGIYIGKILEQVKERPLYIVDKTINL